MAKQKTDYLIIGNSAAGINAIEAIRERDKKGKITLVDQEDTPVYSKPLLSYYIAGKVDDEKLLYRPRDFYEKNEVVTLFGQKATAINPKQKKVFLDSGEISCDQLLLATGSSPIFPNLKGVHLKGVFVVRKFADAKGILERTRQARDVLFVGGGFVSLRTAYALHQRGLKVTIVVASDQLLSRSLDLEAANIVRTRLEQKGFKIITGRDVTQIEGREEVEGVSLDNGELVKAQLVVIGKGVRPNVSLARDSGIRVNKGILVDDYLQTNQKHIYAAGDVAETFDVAREERALNALWPNATEQGHIAGLNMAGAKRKYAGSLGMNSLEFFDLPLISMGVTNPYDKEDFEILVKRVPEKNIYKKVVLKKGVVKGAILVGEIDRAGLITGIIKEKTNVSAFKEELLEEGFGLIRLPDSLKKEKILEP